MIEKLKPLLRFTASHLKKFKSVNTNPPYDALKIIAELDLPLKTATLFNIEFKLRHENIFHKINLCIKNEIKKKYFNLTFTTNPFTLEVTFELYRPDAEARRLQQAYREEQRLSNIVTSLAISEEETKKTINIDKSFKSDECVICLTKPPNVLFCNCGHLCIFEECSKVKDLYTCPVSKTENTIKRIV